MELKVKAVSPKIGTEIPAPFYATPGAAAMDTVLPVVVGATHERITIYSFTSGVVLSLAVPILVPAIVAIPF